jgi:hypothetical protein
MITNNYNSLLVLELIISLIKSFINNNNNNNNNRDKIKIIIIIIIIHSNKNYVG